MAIVTAVNKQTTWKAPCQSFLSYSLLAMSLVPTSERAKGSLSRQGSGLWTKAWTCAKRERMVEPIGETTFGEEARKQGPL